MVFVASRLPAPLALCFSGVLALSLGACGGSGGDSAPSETLAPAPAGSSQTGADTNPPSNNNTARVTITNDLAPELAASMLSSASSMSEAEMFAVVSLTADAQAAASMPRSAGAPPLPENNRISMAQIARELLNQTFSGAAATSVAAPTRASTTTTYDCATGGAWTYERVDADGDGRLSAGDITTLTFENCSGELDGTVNGSLRQQLTQFDALFGVDGIPTDVFVWEATYTFTNFNYQREGFSHSANGTFIVDLDDDQTAGKLTARFLAPQLEVTQGQRSYLFSDLESKTIIDHVQATHSAQINGTVTDSVLGTYEIETVQAIIVPFTDNAGANFLQGKMLIRGENSTLTATFLDDGSIEWEVDNNGDGIVDGGWVSG